MTFSQYSKQEVFSKTKPSTATLPNQEWPSCKLLLTPVPCLLLADLRRRLGQLYVRAFPALRLDLVDLDRVLRPVGRLLLYRVRTVAGHVVTPLLSWPVLQRFHCLAVRLPPALEAVV